MYSISCYKTDEISCLRDDWKRLEKGSDMTFYQRYDWYERLSTLNTQHYNKHEFIFVACKNDDNEITLIAPLWIIKKTTRLINKKGVYFFGCQGWNDYCNIIYNEFKPEAFICMMQYLKNKYNISYYCLDFIKEETDFHKWLLGTNSCVKLVQNNRSKCVGLAIPENLDTYKAKLTKKSRQNIRTAVNRFSNHCIEYNVVFNDTNIDRDLFKLHREKRNKYKNRWSFRTCLGKIKLLMQNKLRLKHQIFNPFEWDYHDIRFLTIYSGNELMSSFCYGYDEVHQEIVVMAGSLNDKYSWYSPGMISWYEYISNNFASNDIRYIDFTRGNEKYKYSLGGVDHMISSVQFMYLNTSVS